MVCGQFALPPEVGVPFVHRIEAGIPAARRRARPEGRAKKWEAYAADALVEMFSEGGGPRRGVRSELVLVCSVEAYWRGHVHADEGEVCHIIGGGPVPVTIAWEVAKGAFLKAAWVGGTDIEKVKHFGRHIPAELRTALDLGAGPDFAGRQCEHPGCGVRYGLQYDHIDPVANQGETSDQNIQALCYDCHQRKTDRDRKAGLLGPHARPRTQEPRAGPFDDP